MKVEEYLPLYGHISGTLIMVDGEEMLTEELFEQYPEAVLNEYHIALLDTNDLHNFCRVLNAIKDEFELITFLRDTFDNYRSNGGDPMHWLLATFEHISLNPESFPAVHRGVIEKNVLLWIDNFKNAPFDLLRIHSHKWDTNIPDIEASINSAVERLQKFTAGEIKKYKYFGFVSAVANLVAQIKKPEYFTYENSRAATRLIPTLSELKKSVGVYTGTNNDCQRDIEEITYLVSSKFSEIQDFITEEEYQDFEKYFEINKPAIELSYTELALLHFYKVFSNIEDTVTPKNKDQIAQRYGKPSGSKLYMEYLKICDQSNRTQLTGSERKDDARKKRFEIILPLLKDTVAYPRANDEFNSFLKLYEKHYP